MRIRDLMGMVLSPDRLLGIQTLPATISSCLIDSGVRASGAINRASLGAVRQPQAAALSLPCRHGADYLTKLRALSALTSSTLMRAIWLPLKGGYTSGCTLGAPLTTA